jgi:pimeloyl-ACP methyl ester carboxylesterase
LLAASVSAVALAGIARRARALSEVTGTAGRGGGDEIAASRYNRERRFAEIPAGRIAYIDRGTGPAALFLHGFPLSSFQWRGAIDRLSNTRRCVAPDFLGLGYTEVAPNQSVAPAAQVGMLVALLDHLDVREVDLIANDSGGAVAQLFVTQHPERVRTLLLTNCDTEPDSPPAAVVPVIELAPAGVYPDLWLEPWLRHKDVARSANGLGGLCYSNPAHPTDAALEQYLGPLVASAERKAWVNGYALGLAPNPLAGMESRLKQCRAPARLVWGMSDTIFSARGCDYLAGILPRLTGVRRIREAKLFFPEEYPDIIAQEARLLWGAATHA